MIVSAPTSSGKTTIFELCMMKELNKGSLKCLYIAPIKALCQEKLNSWGKKFGKHAKIQELTSDNLDTESLEIDEFGIIVATPEKIDFFSRKNL
jgi:ATP-dependent DNA helicase HFM1/MER3